MRDQAGKLAVRSDRAEVIAENMLVAYNSGDYQALSKDWSRPMRFVIREHAFRRFRRENLPITDPFKAIISVTPTPAQHDPGHMSYQVRARFEKRDGVLFTITLSSGSAKVEGVEFKAQFRSRELLTLGAPCPVCGAALTSGHKHIQDPTTNRASLCQQSRRSS